MTATHVHAPVLRSNSEIAAQAREIHPLQFAARAVLTSVAFVLVAIGWVAGSLWFSVVFSALWSASRIRWAGQCARHGFIKGARVKVVPKG